MIYFNNLSTFNKKEFINQLLQEISLILPVDLDRLESDGPDTSSTSEQLIIHLQINSIKDSTKRNAYNLYRDLDIMIVNKGFTEISKYQYTSLLDQTYGYKLNGKLILKIFLNLLMIKLFNFFFYF